MDEAVTLLAIVLIILAVVTGSIILAVLAGVMTVMAAFALSNTI